MSPLFRRVLLWAMGVVAALVLVVQLAPALVLPGKVSQGHARIETDCFACHQVLLGPRAERCATCHAPGEIGAAAETRPARPAVAAIHREPGTQACLACHTDHRGQDPAAATARFDHGVLSAARAADCGACHAAPADALHARITGDCGQCHGTRAWRPATFEHDAYFRFDRRHPPDCASCHPGDDLAQYTCYGCHEHSPAKIRREHLEEGIRDYEPCAVCHRTAREHDAERLWRDLRRRGISPSEAARAGRPPGSGALAPAPADGGASPAPASLDQPERERRYEDDVDDDHHEHGEHDDD